MDDLDIFTADIMAPTGDCVSRTSVRPSYSTIITPEERELAYSTGIYSPPNPLFNGVIGPELLQRLSGTVSDLFRKEDVKDEGEDVEDVGAMAARNSVSAERNGLCPGSLRRRLVRCEAYCY